MKSCLECEENYRSWRQKFCSDGCRNAYNNKINKTVLILCATLTISCAKIIAHSIGSQSMEIKKLRAKLLSKVWLWVFTNILQTKTGNTYYFLYDQGYLLLDNDFYMLVKRDI
jgi:hypothetical protein